MIRRAGCLLSFTCIFLSILFAQSAKHSDQQKMLGQLSVDEKLFNGIRWRQIGPFRGGRVLAVTGVPGEPNVFYFGAASGGVWKTSDAGANWQPLFDKQPIA